jgi:hypothetical protein
MTTDEGEREEQGEERGGQAAGAGKGFSKESEAGAELDATVFCLKIGDATPS